MEGQKKTLERREGDLCLGKEGESEERRRLRRVVGGGGEGEAHAQPFWRPRST